MFRNLLILLLATLLIAAFVLLNSLLRDAFAIPAARANSSSTATRVALVATSTATASATSTLTTTTPTFTPTSTPTLTPSPTATSSLTPTPTPFVRTFVIPFRQIIGLNENNPQPTGRVWMYEGYNDVFEVLARVPPNARVQSLDGAAKFWVSEDALAPNLPPAPAYDFSVRGKRATTRSTTPNACSYNASPTLAFGPCENLSNVNVITLVAAISADVRKFYQIEFRGRQFIINAGEVVQILEATPQP